MVSDAVARRLSVLYPSSRTASAPTSPSPASTRTSTSCTGANASPDGRLEVQVCGVLEEPLPHLPGYHPIDVANNHTIAGGASDAEQAAQPDHIILAPLGLLRQLHLHSGSWVTLSHKLGAPLQHQQQQVGGRHASSSSPPGRTAVALLVHLPGLPLPPSPTASCSVLLTPLLAYNLGIPYALAPFLTPPASTGTGTAACPPFSGCACVAVCTGGGPGSGPPTVTASLAPAGPHAAPCTQLRVPYLSVPSTGLTIHASSVTSPPAVVASSSSPGQAVAGAVAGAVAAAGSSPPGQPAGAAAVAWQPTTSPSVPLAQQVRIVKLGRPLVALLPSAAAGSQAAGTGEDGAAQGPDPDGPPGGGAGLDGANAADMGGRQGQVGGQQGALDAAGEAGGSGREAHGSGAVLAVALQAYFTRVPR